MRQTSGTRKSHGKKIVKDIKRATRKQYSSEEKVRIVLGGLRGEDSIAEFYRREGTSQGIYYKWSKDFMESGIYLRAGLAGRKPTSVRRQFGSQNVCWCTCADGIDQVRFRPM